MVKAPSRTLLGAAAVVVFAAVAAIATAGDTAVPPGVHSGVVTACVEPATKGNRATSGDLNVLVCLKGARRISWNIRGPRGVRGLAMPAGPGRSGRSRWSRWSTGRSRAGRPGGRPGRGRRQGRHRPRRRRGSTRAGRAGTRVWRCGCRREARGYDDDVGGVLDNTRVARRRHGRRLVPVVVQPCPGTLRGCRESGGAVGQCGHGRVLPAPLAHARPHGQSAS